MDRTPIIKRDYSALTPTQAMSKIRRTQDEICELITILSLDIKQQDTIVPKLIELNQTINTIIKAFKGSLWR